MKKLQQYYIPKFLSSRLDNNDYNITRSLEDLRNKGELVSLADSQALRTIRRIRYDRYPDYIKYDEEELKMLKQKLKQAIKGSDPDRKQVIQDCYYKIDKMLYIPEYITVVIEQIKHYKHIIKNGFYYNGYKYVRLCCGAGMARVNTVAFIREDFEEEIKKCLRNGISEDNKGFFIKAFEDFSNPNFKITKNKYNAYFALASSATYRVTTPKCVVVDDCEINMVKKVDWVEPVKTNKPFDNIEKIVTKDAELNFNLFDGGGIIDISLARQWAEDLELDYIPSVFIVRNIFIKGCLFVMDLHKFENEVAKQHGIIDLWGKIQNVSDKNVILTKSMFKLWNAYESIEQYQDLCDYYGNYWGISRVPPKNDNDCITTNYQFCQVFNFDEEDVKKFCQPTADWLNGVAGLDRNQALLFLIGSLANQQYEDIKVDIFDKISDNLTKALIVNPEMIHDEYLQQVLRSAINKKIKESYIGKLIVNGNFQTMIPDPYALLEWVFANGDVSKVHGLLNEFEHYSQYWNNKNSTNIIAMRSPLTWRSEATKLNLKNDEKMQEWYQYLYSGIVYNVWGCDCMLHADSDYDGDIVCTTSNESMLQCKHYDEFNNLPVTYEKKTVPKEIIREKDLWKADVKSFNSTIGTITNYSTSMYDLLCKFKNKDDLYSKKCYNEILERLKLTRKAQGDAIDKAKGVQVNSYPDHWINRQKINPDDDEELIEKKKFLNDICADRKPYFFYYRYPACKTDYDSFILSEKRYVAFISDRELDEVIKQPAKNELEFADEYYKFVPLIDYDSPMNKICHYMENTLKETKLSTIQKTPDHVIKLMSTGEATEDEVLLIKQYYKSYAESRRSFRVNADINLEQCAKQIRKDAISNFESTERIANAVVKLFYIDNYSQGKSFAWNVFGKYLLDNIVKNTNTLPNIPMRSENGNIEYLYKNYSEVEFSI